MTGVAFTTSKRYEEQIRPTSFLDEVTIPHRVTDRRPAAAVLRG